jgi:hypothetical protein
MTDPTIKLGPDGESFTLTLYGQSGSAHFIRIPATAKGLLILKALLHQREYYPRDERIAQPGEPIQHTITNILRAMDQNTTQELVEEWLANGGEITRVGKRRLPDNFTLEELGIDLSNLDFGEAPPPEASR